MKNKYRLSSVEFVYRIWIIYILSSCLDFGCIFLGLGRRDVLRDGILTYFCRKQGRRRVGGGHQVSKQCQALKSIKKVSYDDIWHTICSCRAPPSGLSFHQLKESLANDFKSKFLVLTFNISQLRPNCDHHMTVSDEVF